MSIHQVVQFLHRQFIIIGNGGAAVIWRKIGKMVAWLLLGPVALVIVVVVRSLRSVVLLRFGSLVSDRLGHFAANTEIYLCKCEVVPPCPHTFDIFYHNHPISNYQLKKMWDRILVICSLAFWVDRVNRLLPGGSLHMIPLKDSQDYPGIYLSCTAPHLTFTSEEERDGINKIREIGIRDGIPFVCFHARDSAYLSKTHPSRDWRYHDYRDSDIGSYMPAAELLAERGYYLVRMGSVVNKSLIVSNSRIIDYATSRHRSDFLDIYLSAKCFFFVANGSGLDSVPTIFRRPVAYVNYIPLNNAPTWGPQDLFIPKKIWSQRERRLLTFWEMLNLGDGKGLFHGENYEQLGLSIVDNTPEEITSLGFEMEQRLRGCWQTLDEDKILQDRFWRIFESVYPFRKVHSRIGAKFLRQNIALLS